MLASAGLHQQLHHLCRDRSPTLGFWFRVLDLETI